MIAQLHPAKDKYESKSENTSIDNLFDLGLLTETYKAHLK